MASSEGTKVTKDPQALNNPKTEKPGIVTSDSLAAQSVSQGGDFAANASTTGVMSQPSASTTTNTTDISGATQLDAASDAQTRQAGQPAFNTGGNPSKDAGGSTSKDTGVGPTYNTATSGGSSGDAPAPSKPHGKNVAEGGIPSDAPNASFTTDIGGENDPGRAALKKLEADNVPVASGAGPAQGGVTGAGQFKDLGETSS